MTIKVMVSSLQISAWLSSWTVLWTELISLEHMIQLIYQPSTWLELLRSYIEGEYHFSTCDSMCSPLTSIECRTSILSLYLSEGKKGEGLHRWPTLTGMTTIKYEIRKAFLLLFWQLLTLRQEDLSLPLALRLFFCFCVNTSSSVSYQKKRLIPDSIVRLVLSHS